MLVTNLLIEIEKPITISKKLGIYMVNPKHIGQDTYNFLKNKILKAIDELNDQGQYSISISDLINDSSIRNILEIEKNISHENFIDSIINKLCLLEMKDENTTFLNEVNYNIFTINEINFEFKFLKLFQFYDSCNINKIYSSNNPLDVSSLILNLYFNKRDFYYNGRIAYFYYLEYRLKRLKDFGKIIDKTLSSFNDLYTLDYIGDLLIESQGSSKLAIISYASIIELFLINPHNSIRNQFSKKLKMFIKNNEMTESELNDLAKLLYDVRSSLAHGNVKALNKDLNKYSKVYNKNYNYDLTEFKRESWDLISISLLYYNIVKNILKFYFSDKKLLYKIKYDNDIFVKNKQKEPKIIGIVRDFKNSYERCLISDDDYNNIVNQINQLIK